MSTRFEGSFKSSDQTEIFYHLWSVESPRGTMVVTHGLAEHGECYHPLAKALQPDGWETYSWDLRGHGRSEGKRGFVRDFQDYVTDLRQFVELILRHRRDREAPLILFGHSMGGLITALLACDWPKPPFQAIVWSSPLFGLALPVPKIKDQVARLAARWLPSLTLFNELKYADLSRDEGMLKSYDQDVLRHDRVSPGVYMGMMEGFEALREKASRIEVPVLLQMAGSDRVVSGPSAQDIFQRLPNKRNVLEIYPESLHEIYNDLDREQALADLRKFINQFQVKT